MGIRINSTKTLRMKNGFQAALRIIRPSMVGAHHNLAVSGAFHQFVGAVLAHIEERAHLAVAAADAEQVLPCDLEREVIPRIFHLGYMPCIFAIIMGIDTAMGIVMGIIPFPKLGFGSAPPYMAVLCPAKAMG